jgi:hypothetical protein
MQYSSDSLTCFLYDLLKHHLPADVVEKLVRDNESTYECSFSNPHLAEYASELARRLYRNSKPPTQGS